MSAPPVDLYAELVNSSNPANRLNPVSDLLSRRVVRMAPFRIAIPACTDSELTREHVCGKFKPILRLNDTTSLESWPVDKIENEKIMTQIGWAATTIPDFEYKAINELSITYGCGYIRVKHVVRDLHSVKHIFLYYKIQFYYKTQTLAQMVFDLENYTLVVTSNQKSKAFAPLRSLTQTQDYTLTLPELVV